MQYSLSRIALVLLSLTTLASCTSSTSTPTSTEGNTGTVTPTASGYSLDFDATKYTTGSITISGSTVAYRAYENIVYVKNPVDATYQSMNIYVPEAYYTDGTVNGYNAKTAPIFFPNQVGGYMPATPGTVNKKITAGQWGNGAQTGATTNMGNMPPSAMGSGSGMPAGGMMPRGGANGTSTIASALAHGYVVASPGARGRTLQDANGTYTGKAPAVIVDLLAAVRYLHYNDAALPGDSEKIISNGTSAGGAVSALLGAAGGSHSYDEYLTALGAADASDRIYAVSAYCPITNLDHADMAYEWLFDGLYQVTARNASTGTALADDRIALSKALAKNFPTYLNSLNLKDKNGNPLMLDANGDGTFKEAVKKEIIASAQAALNAGTDLSTVSFLTITDRKVVDVNMDSYISTYLTRMKTPPAFDDVGLTAGENNLFGTKTVNARHFTDFGQQHSTATGTAERADAQLVALMNPMTFFTENNTNLPEYWRIRHGAKDSDTAVAIPYILALSLENLGYTVDFAIPWSQGHGGDYDLVELFGWIDTIVRK